jgi:hypothetical protein
MTPDPDLTKENPPTDTPENNRRKKSLQTEINNL